MFVVPTTSIANKNVCKSYSERSMDYFFIATEISLKTFWKKDSFPCAIVGRKADPPLPSRSQICPSGQLRFYFTGDAVEAEFDGTSVLALGSPLFDTAFLDNDKVGAASVYVTLASSELGIWNPFSWYPYVPATKWAAIVTERSTVDDVAVLFDRGYGWVYLTSETGFETKSTTPCCLDRYKAESYRSTGEFLELRSRWYRCRLEWLKHHLRVLADIHKAITILRISDLNNQKGFMYLMKNCRTLFSHICWACHASRSGKREKRVFKLQSSHIQN